MIEKMTRADWSSLLVGMGLGMDDSEELARMIREWLKAKRKRSPR